MFGAIIASPLLGVLAILAAFFPTTFARLAITLERWRVFLIIACTTSSLSVIYFLIREGLPESKWLGGPAFSAYLTGITAIGVVWAGRRFRYIAAEFYEATVPSKRELKWLAGISLVNALAIGTTFYLGEGEIFGDVPWREMLLIAIGLAAAFVYVLYRRLWPGLEPLIPPPRQGLSSESVALGATFLAGLCWTLLIWPRAAVTTTIRTEVGEIQDEARVQLRVLFEATKDGRMASSPIVVGERIYIGSDHDSGFHQWGALFCIDRTTGKQLRYFDDEEDMKPVFSAPAVSGNRVFIGEGFHANKECRLYGLDTETFKPLWLPVQTKSHTEGSPCVVDGRVYFAAGDDGLYCVDEQSGKVVWHFEGAEQRLHIDTPPTVVGKRLFAGSGYRTNAVLCLDSETGKQIWRTKVPYRVFGQPLYLGGQVFVGIGTGNLSLDLHSDESIADETPERSEPAGMILCLDGRTGAIVWQYETPRSVHPAVAGDRRAIYAACRNGTLYALDRRTGKLRWKVALGLSLSTSPIVVKDEEDETLCVYAISTAGLVVALRPQTGKVIWSRDTAKLTEREVECLSTPTIVAPNPHDKREIYFGVMLQNVNNRKRTAAVIRIDDVVPLN